MAIFDRKNEKAFEKIVEDYDLKDLKKEDLELIFDNSALIASGGVYGVYAQNWIMIKQLDRLNKNIEKLIEDKNDK